MIQEKRSGDSGSPKQDDAVEVQRQFERQYGKKIEDVDSGLEIVEKIQAVRSAIKDTRPLGTLLDTFALDPLIGLVPELGDVAPVLLSAYVVYKAKKAELPTGKILKMVANIGLDIAIGAIPIIGDVADFFFKANKRNVRIMEQYYEELLLEARRKNIDVPNVLQEL